jgi:hypothetical protein
MYLNDSAQTNYTISSLLGSFNDPIFGLSKASIYAEVFPSTYGAVPWENIPGKVDSVILLLPLSGGQPYGSTDPQSFSVYRTDSNIAASTAYYSNHSMAISTLIGSAQINIAHAVGTDTFRIKLNSSFLNYIENQSEFSNNWTSNFNKGLLQGIYITPENPLQLPGQGAAIYLNLASPPFGGIYVYYHHYAYPDSALYVILPIGGSSGAYFDHFDHSYSTSPINSSNPVGIRDSVTAPQLIYVQAMGGVVGRINMPNLYKNWSKLGPIIINEATVTLPIDLQDETPTFGPPDYLYLLGTSQTTWGPYATPDQGQTYYGGTSNGTAYTFVITQYIQSIINGKNDSDRGLYIVPGNSSVTANRVVLYGAKHGTVPSNKATLTISYTPVKNP